jgi:hypothetical protein
MFVRLRSPAHAAAQHPTRSAASFLSPLALCLFSWLSACGSEVLGGAEEVDGGPCGRGKARSCQCDDGRRGIAQCLVATSEWGECWCESGEPPDAGAPAAAWTSDAQTPIADPTGPKSVPACDDGFELRAHAPGGSDPYLVRGGAGLAAGGDDTAVCFFAKTPYSGVAAAQAFVGLPDEVISPQQWRLYGIDESMRRDGEVFPCAAREPDAYLLAGFTPGDHQLALPGDVALALPSGPSAGLILEVRYPDPGPVALLDRTGIRICAAEPGEREHTAAVQVVGSEGICIPPGATDFEVSGTCAPRSDQGALHILNVSPHMHARGKRMTIRVERVDGSSETLLDGPFYPSQPVPRPELNVVLAPGDHIETRCYYDNPGLLAVPFGGSSYGEKCYGYITAWAAGAPSADPGALDPLRSLGLTPSRRCLDPISIFASCNGPADYAR